MFSIMETDWHICEADVLADVSGFSNVVLSVFKTANKWKLKRQKRD